MTWQTKEFGAWGRQWVIAVLLQCNLCNVHAQGFPMVLCALQGCVSDRTEDTQRGGSKPCIIILYYLLKDHCKAECMMAGRKWNESDVRGVFKMEKREFDWRMIKAVLPISFLLFLLDSPLPSVPFPHKYSTNAQKLPLSLSLPRSPCLLSTHLPRNTHTYSVREMPLKACRPKLSEQPSPSPALLLSLPFHSLTPSHPAPIILPPSAAPWTPLPLPRLSFRSPAAGTTTALWMHHWFRRSLTPTPSPPHFSPLSTPSKLL